ncbi:MAG: hypothetical protein AABX89_06720 [Candidatus Thermoplasmatota archaeon]
MSGPILRPAPQPIRAPTPLARLNRFLAQPLASFFIVLGVAPGQLSLQSFTLTLVGLARAADGSWPHVVLGAGFVYLGLLADRADLLIMERKGRPGLWTEFLGIAVDRLVEVSILVGLGALTVIGMPDAPVATLHLMSDGWTMVAASAAVGLLLATRAVEATGETFLLRAHLLATRRLPGTVPTSTRPPSRSQLAIVAGRDETLLLAALSALTAQPDLGLLAILGLQFIAFFEQLVLFRSRLRDPEAEASRLLGPDYP